MTRSDDELLDLKTTRLVADLRIALAKYADLPTHVTVRCDSWQEALAAKRRLSEEEAIRVRWSWVVSGDPEEGAGGGLR